MAATVDQICDAITDFADYEEVRSTDRARKYITACRRFLSLPANSSSGGGSLGYNQATIQAELDYARRWLAANDAATTAGTTVRFLSASEGFRR